MSQQRKQEPKENVSRLVVKLGTGVLAPSPVEIETERLAKLAESISELREQNTAVTIVSSGAVGLGMGKLGVKDRPGDLAELRACAAVGQSLLMNLWREALEAKGLIPAQILLTREDFRSRKSSMNVEHTLKCLLEKGAIPIVNENNTGSLICSMKSA